MRALRGRVSGLAQPTYVLDIPGGYGKVPVGPGYIDMCGEAGAVVEDINGVKRSIDRRHPEARAQRRRQSPRTSASSGLAAILRAAPCFAGCAAPG